MKRSENMNCQILHQRLTALQAYPKYIALKSYFLGLFPWLFWHSSQCNRHGSIYYCVYPRSCVYLYSKTLGIASFSFFCRTFPEYGGIRSKKKFKDRRTANAMQLFVAIKGNYFGLFFFWTSRREGKFPKEIPQRPLGKYNYLLIFMSLK